MNTINPKQFKIINYQHILPGKTIKNDNNDPHYLFELPIEFGGTLNTDNVAKAKGTEATFDIKTGKPME